MPNPFDIIKAKVGRAEKHLRDFDVALKAFYDTAPYEVVHRDYPEIGKRGYHVGRVDDVPLELATIASDLIQNLRSSLDQLAVQLVVGHGGKKQIKSVSYPIAGAVSDYLPLRNGTLGGDLPRSILDAVDETEPYKDGNGHGLWQLNDISRVDRHRLLISTSSSFGGIHFADVYINLIEPELGSEFSDPIWGELINDMGLIISPKKTLPMKVGDSLYLGKIPKAGHEQHFSFEVALDTAGVIEIEPALKTLTYFTELVTSTVLKFQKFF